MEGMVSVIIPVYNRQDVLRECVASVLGQTYENIEVLLIDDGSADRSLAICRELSAQDARVRVLEQQHGGVSAARNMGLEAARGEYVCFVDSDDVIHPRLLETLIPAMKSSGAEIAGSKALNVRQQDWCLVKEQLEQTSQPGQTVYQPHEQAVQALFFGDSPMDIIGSIVMRRDLIGQTRFRTDLFIGEDFFFFYENLIKGAAVVCLKEKWYYCRIHGSNSSWNYGFDGFYSRFYRRELVWKSEEAFGRTEYAKRQKQDAVAAFFQCVRKEGVSREDRRRMRAVMRKYQKTLVPALTSAEKVWYYLAVYAPAVYSALFGLKRKLKAKKQRT